MKFALRKVSLLSALLFFTLFSCKEEGDLVPQFNTTNLNVLDTVLTVTTTTVLGDSLRTDRVSRNLLGKINDATFGLSTADFYTQFYMPSSVLPIADNAVFDSVILELGYDEFYGHSYDQEVRVYEITEDLDPEAPYYSNHTATTSDVLIGSSIISVSSTDSLEEDSTYVLRIKIDDEIGERIGAHGTFDDQESFLQLIKGFKITTDPMTVPGESGEGAIVYFNLTSSKTKLKLWYFDENNNEPASIDFYVDVSNAQRFSHFEWTHSANMIAKLNKADEDINYVAAVSGVRTKVTVDNASEWDAEAPIAINRAELIIPYEASLITENVPPDRLLIW